MINLILLLMPSFFKIKIYRAMGCKIGKDCWIGISIINAKKIEISDNVRIGHFNLIWRLKELKIDSGSTINMFNWITGGKKGVFRIGRNSAITRFHFFEASANITIGNNSIVAGRGSHFYTHGISPTNLNDMRPIIIGDWCYIGSSSRFVPGAEIARGTFVGMGAIVTKKFEKEYVLIAGSPAIIKKQLSPLDPYFNRKFLPHAHHKKNYLG